MTNLKRWAPLAGVAFALSFGLAACDQPAGPEQQSSNTLTEPEQSSDAAATTEQTEQKTE